MRDEPVRVDPVRASLLRDAGPVLLLLLPSIGAVVRIHDGHPPAAQVVAAVALWLPALARRHRPRAAFAVTAALLLAVWGAAGLDVERLPPSGAALLLCLVVVADRCPHRVGLAAAGVCEVLALLTLLSPGPAGGGHPVVPLTAVTAAALLLGRNRRAQRAVLAGLQERAERAEADRDQQTRVAVAEERTRIAREVHDVVSHSVSVMTALADGAGAALATRSAGGRDPAREAVAAIASTGREALADMHRLLGVLRAPDEAVERVPAPGLGDLSTLVEQVRAAGVPTTLTVRGSPAPLGTATALAVYRLVQEALTNTLQHAAGARSAGVLLDWSATGLTVEVADDGPARAARTTPGRVGHGLVGMRERMAAHGGTVAAGPRPEGGWRVAATLPLPPAAVPA